MGFAEFIENKFIGHEMCIFLGEDVETIILGDQHWISNKAYFRGTIESVEEGVLTLIIPNSAPLYINCEEITAIWPPSFDYHKAVSTSLTRRMVGAKYKDVS
jgi:hypothetical protein